jgi:hypothetical protein
MFRLIVSFVAALCIFGRGYVAYADDIKRISANGRTNIGHSKEVGDEQRS